MRRPVGRNEPHTQIGKVVQQQGVKTTDPPDPMMLLVKALAIVAVELSPIA